MSKTILITGGAGFVGHHCVEHIIKNTDWKIIILDSLNYAGNMNRITELSPSYVAGDMNRVADINVFDSQRVKFVWHDLRSPISPSIHKLIGDLDYLIHFAAESHVDRSLEDSIPFVMSNVVGTANLLEYLKHFQKGCKTIIFSTDEVFGPAPGGIYFKEDDVHRPSNPYAAAKSGEEMIAFSFSHSFGMPVSVVRSMNIIGERQCPEKFLPKTIRAILNNKKVMLHGKGKNDLSSRCWIHARNVSDALFFLLDKAQKEEFYHIVGEERTVLEIANWVCQVIKGKDLEDNEIEWVDYHSARPGHDKRYALSGEKLAAMGWNPPIDLEHSIKKTVEWSLKSQRWLNY
jgi:dTDP-glucose 4,6-dehydratase